MWIRERKNLIGSSNRLTGFLFTLNSVKQNKLTSNVLLVKIYASKISQKNKKLFNFWHFDLTFLTSREKNSRKVLNLNLYDVSKTVYDFHAWKKTNCQNVDYTGCSSAVSSDLSFSRNLTRVWSLSEIGLVSDWYPELSDCYPPIRALSTLIRNSDSQSEVKNRDDQFEFWSSKNYLSHGIVSDLND